MLNLIKAKRRIFLIRFIFFIRNIHLVIIRIKRNISNEY